MQNPLLVNSLFRLLYCLTTLMASGLPYALSFPRKPEIDAIQTSPYSSPISGDSILLRFGGDCLLAGHYEDDAGDSVNLAFDGFDLLKTADIAMVNLECPVTTRGKRVDKPYNFRMHPRFLSALTGAGIDVVSIANNHIYDFGRVGLFDTISYLDSVGIRHVGAGRNRTEARTPVVVSTNDKSVALLAYYGGSEAPKATSRKPGVADRDIETIQADIAKLKLQNPAAYIVVNLHWGTEKATIPDQEQIEFAHEVIDAGADLIIGHHPHVLQGIEKYKSGVIVYSLGNFVFGGNSRDTYNTALFEVRLHGNNVAYRLIPVAIEGWRARELSGEEGDDVVRAVHKLSRYFSKTIFTN